MLVVDRFDLASGTRSECGGIFSPAQVALHEDDGQLLAIVTLARWWGGGGGSESAYGSACLFAVGQFDLACGKRSEYCRGSFSPVQARDDNHFLLCVSRWLKSTVL